MMSGMRMEEETFFSLEFSGSPSVCCGHRGVAGCGEWRRWLVSVGMSRGRRVLPASPDKWQNHLGSKLFVRYGGQELNDECGSRAGLAGLSHGAALVPPQVRRRWAARGSRRPRSCHVVPGLPRFRWGVHLQQQTHCFGLLHRCLSVRHVHLRLM